MPKRVVELLVCWKGRFCWNDFNIVWNVINPFLFIVVHLERNECSKFQRL
jgi:hypothetical protein